MKQINIFDVFKERKDNKWKKKTHKIKEKNVFEEFMLYERIQIRRIRN